ncbi:hypothetical protein OF83DRAFT_1120804 [Amylostereum chailletii]|nr:hypothetical protein OF83DRAFT_1120804 [Amylostereum chailletii]
MLPLLRCSRPSWPAIPFPILTSIRYTSQLSPRKVLENLDELERGHARLLRVVEEGYNASISLRDKDGAASYHNLSLGKQRKSLKPLEQAWTSWLQKKAALTDTLPLFDDPELSELAESESQELLGDMKQLVTDNFPSIVIPPSDTADMSALMELKSGVGGSEASLFLSELMRVYTRFAFSKSWVPTVVASNESDSGGIKDSVLEIKGVGAYDALRWESGVHRVQRVPATEASGRVHTSTVAVVVLPLSEEPSSEGQDDLFNMEDVRVEVMRARGAGGQHVNKTESAVRLTHMPTGISVSMQDERSQHQNRRRAFQILRARLMDRKIIQDQIDHRAARKSLVRTADRSEKIRTYNYSQDRVTDHRLRKQNLSWDDVLEGDGLEVVIDDLDQKHKADLLEEKLTVRA